MTLKSCRAAVALMLLAVCAVSAAGSVSLVEAVRNRDVAAVRTMLKQHANVDSPDPDGSTALHWAVYNDDLQSAALLVEAKGNVKAANRFGVTPLSLAAQNGNPKMVELLLKAGADPNASMSAGETVLMTAARTGNAETLKLLLGRGANVNAKETWRGQTALMWAAAEGHVNAVEVLAQAGANLKERSNGGLSALLFAVREGNVKVVQALLKAGADVNETTAPPPTARRRPAGQADSGEPAGGTSALVLAVANAHYELASLLLDAGADPNAAEQGWTALHQITWIRNPGQGDNKPAPEGSGAITSMELIRRLIARGANVNAKMTKKAEMGSTDLNNVGATPFLLAARAADTEMMKMLVAAGADPFLANADGTTPLLAASGVGTHSPGEDAGIENEAVAATKLALELGGDINAVDKNGETAMHGAAYKQFPAVVKFLSENGARKEIWNQKNKFGWTPLMIAEGVQRGNNIRTSAPTATAIRELVIK